MTTVSKGSGTIVLAAFRPDPELFRIQLQSIRGQTRRDWRCLIGADGDQAEVRRLVEEFVGDDDRFEVIGWDDNVGLYLNIERLLQALPADSAWVALADQDDRWHADKLERLIPLLDHVALATGQAKVVRWPDGTVLTPSTRRAVVSTADLIMENQVTGSLTVLRRSLLEIAVPFPRLHTVTQLHDHWLGMVAVASGGGYAVLDEVVQEYVQHGSNLIGEVATHRRWTPAGVLARIRVLADTYEGGHSLAQCSRACHSLGFGWRRLMADTLASRLVQPPPELAAVQALLTPTARRRDAVRLLTHGLASPRVSPWVVATFLPGLPHELSVRRRHRRTRRHPSSDQQARREASAHGGP